MINFLKITLLICVLSIMTTDAQTNISPGVSTLDFIDIQSLVVKQFGVNYEISDIVNVDSALGNRSVADGAINDPYQTLSSCYIFIAQRQSLDDTTVSNGVIGIIKNGNIIWNSGTVINCNASVGSSISVTRDLNQDGKVEIITSWFEGAKGDIERLWIFTWDGKNGSMINALNQNNESELISTSPGYKFVDIDGDGILEITGLWFENENDEEMKKIIYSWNGMQYGKWINAPQPLPSGFYPRDKVDANLKSKVSVVGNKYTYTYYLENKITSKQSINEFLLNTPPDSIENGQGPNEWRIGGVNGKGLGWLAVFDLDEIINPGKIASPFYFETSRLPAIIKSFIRGKNGNWVEIFGDSVEYTLDQWYDEAMANSFKVTTIGPTDPPNPFVPLNFLDSLTSFTTRSRQLGWIKQQPTSDKYTGYFSTAKTALQKNQISLTRSTLTQVLHDVDVDSSSTLTSEAYALIKYNTEYLLAHLPITISALDMLDTLRVRTDRTIPNNTPCGRDFKEDLIENIAKAKKELIEKDTIACALYIKMYEKQLCEKYNHRKGKPCVTTDEYNYLYPYEESIVELILPLPPKCGGSCKDKLFDLKSEIGRCTKKGYCSRGEFENGMEEQIDKAVKCIENKDSSGTATCLGLFEQEVQQTYEQTKKRYDERKYVKPEGYITLYYKAEYILEDLEH